MITSVAVFCGSSPGNQEIFVKSAFETGALIAAKKLKLVYGGAKVGLMGAVADGALNADGTVLGVLPRFMTRKEIAHDKLTELICVESMHERKMKMHELSDAVIALPGGFGTMEELFEMLTWLQLGLHSKPIGVLNVNGFYDELEKQVQKMFLCGFLTEKHVKCLIFDENPAKLIEKMEKWENPVKVRWINEDQT
jgi:uncharacterized protein (TIGR00730 family)